MFLIHFSGTGKKEYSIVEKLSQEQFNIDMDVYGNFRECGRQCYAVCNE